MSIAVGARLRVAATVCYIGDNLSTDMLMDGKRQEPAATRSLPKSLGWDTTAVSIYHYYYYYYFICLIIYCARCIYNTIAAIIPDNNIIVIIIIITTMIIVSVLVMHASSSFEIIVFIRSKIVCIIILI